MRVENTIFNEPADLNGVAVVDVEGREKATIEQPVSISNRVIERETLTCSHQVPAAEVRRTLAERERRISVREKVDMIDHDSAGCRSRDDLIYPGRSKTDCRVQGLFVLLHHIIFRVTPAPVTGAGVRLNTR